MWVAGFDLILSCLDAESDRRENLYSVPTQFGLTTALLLARLCHGIAIASLVGVGILFHLGWVYWIGIAVVTGLLAYENAIVTPTDLSRVGFAFFNVNGYVAAIAFLATLGALFL